MAKPLLSIFWAVLITAVAVFSSCTASSPTATSLPTATAVPTSTATPVPTATASPSATSTTAPSTPPVLNDSLVTGRIVDIHEEAVDTTELHINILSSEDVDSLPNLTSDRVGSTIPVLISSSEVASLAVGETVHMNVQMRGGPEQPIAFYGSNIQKAVTSGVPARPNASLVRGQVVSVVASDEAAISAGIPYQVELLIQQVTAVSGLANMLSGKKGTVLTVLVRGPAPELATSNILEATVEFKGDERGAAYYARDVKVLEASPPSQPDTMPFVANAAIVIGVVEGIKPYGRQASTERGWVIELRLQETQDAASMPNLITGKAGTALQVFTSEEQAEELKHGAQITARVTLRLWLDILVFVATEIQLQTDALGRNN